MKMYLNLVSDSKPAENIEDHGTSKAPEGYFFYRPNKDRTSFIFEISEYEKDSIADIDADHREEILSIATDLIESYVNGAPYIVSFE